jgi:acyl-CoA hydrolase
VSPREVDLDALGEAVLALVDNPRVVVAGNYGTPWPVVRALDVALPVWTLHMLNAQVGVPHRAGVRLETCFVGPGMRGQPTLSYIPSRLSLVPLLLRTMLVPDVVVLHTSPPRAGIVSLGTEVNILPAAVESARANGGLVIAAVNPRMPWTSGDAEIPLTDVDVVVEIDEVLPSPMAIAIDAAAADIGARVAARVSDGATLQAGIGAVPDAALQGLRKRTGLQVWAELISDGVMALDRSGALDRDRPINASFLFGSQELYAWADRNPRLRMLRTEMANDPARIAANPLMTSINSALQVDLYAQANAAHIRSRVYSGFGGHTDFVVGALHSPGGQALIALRSWHPKADRSSIVPLLDQPTTSFQHTAVITEQGTAPLWGRNQSEQALALIRQAADPRIRDELYEEARELGLVGPASRR